MQLNQKTEHPYYCEGYGTDDILIFSTVTDFLDVYESSDVDLNLVFRFDIRQSEEGDLSLFLAMMKQRKGIYMPIHCRKYDPATESERLTKYLGRHYARNLENWKPFSATNNT